MTLKRANQDSGQDFEIQPNPVKDPVNSIARIPTHGPGPGQESDVEAALEPNPKPSITPLAEPDLRATSRPLYDPYQDYVKSL